MTRDGIVSATGTNLEGADSPVPPDIALSRLPLLRTFKAIVLVALFVLPFLVESVSFVSLLGAAIILVAALRPAYLWCAGKAPGLPIFPLFTLTFVWTFAFPLLSDSYLLRGYSEAHLLYASLTVTGFLLIATAVWMRVVTRHVPAVRNYRTLPDGSGDTFLVLCFVAVALYLMSIRGGWLFIPGEYNSVIRSVLFGLGSLAAFILPYRWGRGQLSRGKWIVALSALLVYMVVNVTTLFLVSSLITFLLVTAGYTLGRQRVPFAAIGVAVVVFGALHMGKASMRQEHWSGSQQRAPLQPYEYPGFMMEWIAHAFQWDVQADAALAPEDDRSTRRSILDRAGNIHMLLQTQSETAEGRPLMLGATYAIIPELMVPRLIKPDKPSSHEGTTLLNIHYRNQTREQTRATTIGWGLLAESHANFGLFGMAGLALFLGWFYGFATNWTRNVSPLSARFLFAILVMGVAVQAEFTMGVYVTTLFQVSVGLIAISLLLMRPNVAAQEEGDRSSRTLMPVSLRPA